MAGELTLNVNLDDVLALQRQAIAAIGALRQEVGTLATQAEVDALAQQLTALGDRLTTGQAALAGQAAELTGAVAELKTELAAAVSANPAVDLGAAQAAADRADTIAAGLNSTVGQMSTAVDDAQALAAANEPPAPPAP